LCVLINFSSQRTAVTQASTVCRQASPATAPFVEHQHVVSVPGLSRIVCAHASAVHIIISPRVQWVCCHTGCAACYTSVPGRGTFTLSYTDIHAMSQSYCYAAPCAQMVSLHQAGLLLYGWWSGQHEGVKSGWLYTRLLTSLWIRIVCSITLESSAPLVSPDAQQSQYPP